MANITIADYTDEAFYNAFSEAYKTHCFTGPSWAYNRYEQIVNSFNGGFLY